MNNNFFKWLYKSVIKYTRLIVNHIDGFYFFVAKMLNFKWILQRLLFSTCSFEKRVKLLRKMWVTIGNNCEIYPNVSFGSEPYLIQIGNNVRITEWVSLTTHDWGMRVLRNTGNLPNADKFWKIKIGNNVHIWMRSIIMPGVAIGDNVVIGCLSVVTRDIPANSVAAWIPCRIIESIDDYYEKNKNKVLNTKNMTSSKKEKIVWDYYK